MDKIIESLDFLLDESWVGEFFTKNSEAIFGFVSKPNLLKLERSRTFNTESFNMLYILKVDEKEFRFRLSATTQADREPTYLAMKYLFDHGFDQGEVLVPRPIGYFKECNGYIYEDIPGQTVKHELDDTSELLKKKISLAAFGIKAYHSLPLPNFKLWDQDWGLTVESIEKIYPILGSKIMEIRDNLLAQLEKDHDYRFCHGDYKVDNLIFYQDKIYIFDFGSVCKGHKEFDIANFLIHLKIDLRKYGNPEQFDALKQEFIKIYADLNEENLNLYMALISFRILDYFIAFPTYKDNQAEIPFGYQLVKENLKEIGYEIENES